MVAKAEDYRKMKNSIEYQLRAGSVVVLPAYLHVEAIIQQRGSRRIEIKQESYKGTCEKRDCRRCPFPPCQKGEGGHD